MTYAAQSAAQSNERVVRRLDKVTPANLLPAIEGHPADRFFNQSACSAKHTLCRFLDTDQDVTINQRGGVACYPGAFCPNKIFRQELKKQSHVAAALSLEGAKFDGRKRPLLELVARLERQLGRLNLLKGLLDRAPSAMHA